MQETRPRPAWTEADRLAALHAYGILDTAPEQAFDDIVQLVGQLLGAPIVAVNLIDAGRQWFKSEIGLGVREMPLDDSICKFALFETERMLVPDTLNDPRFACNPLVTSGPGLRFYAGEVLRSADGLPLGTLCVLDTVPRPEGLTPLQSQILQTMAQQVRTQMMLRKIVAEQDQLLHEQRATQAALHRARERSRLATEAAGLGLWSWEPVSETVRWENEKPWEILGIDPASAPISARQLVAEIVHPDDAAAFAGAVAATVQRGAPLECVVRIRRPDGELRWLDFHGAAQPARDGEPAQILGVVSDVTTRTLTAMALLESRERFENIVSQAATGVVQADAGGRVTVVNKKFCEMLGYTRSELVGSALLDITAGDSIDVALMALGKVSAGATGVVVQQQYRRQDGSLMWASSSISAVRSPAGELQGIVAIVVDISHDRAVEENLRRLAASLSEADRRKSEFLATLAHELRNPLAPIRTGLTVLKLGGDSPEAVARIRPMMERQVAQMVRLIDDLLDVARITGGKIALKKARVDVKDVLAAAIETSMPVIDNGRHALVVHQPDGTMTIDADATRIAQVLSNLLNNAAKYTPQGGRIVVTVSQEHDQAVVTIADNGIGIPAESLAAIFVLFNQVHMSLHRAQGGLGVGLALVRQLVEMHGGTVEAASAGHGAGTTLTVRLPLAQGDAADATTTPQMRAPHRRLRLLVADDNVDAAQALAAMFALQGHDTRIAHSGVQALATARAFQPQVSFLDIGMPEMNGYETALAMRQLPGLEHTVLVALTGWGNDSDRDLSQQAGFDHHLTKPADTAVIHGVLDAVTKRLTD
ncbi:MAG: PAS domain S-box protein [Pseudomonadota bacterium]|nr:PAS domain S-box protein [Pseudomonadota bacterium]